MNKVSQADPHIPESSVQFSKTAAACSGPSASHERVCCPAQGHGGQQNQQRKAHGGCEVRMNEELRYKQLGTNIPGCLDYGSIRIGRPRQVLSFRNSKGSGPLPDMRLGPACANERRLRGPEPAAEHEEGANSGEFCRKGPLSVVVPKNAPVLRSTSLLGGNKNSVSFRI